MKSRFLRTTGAALLAAFAGECVMCADAELPSRLPKKILCGYSGFWLDRGDAALTDERLLKPMAEAGFSVVDLKIQPTGFDLSNPEHRKRLEELCARVQARGLVLTTYVYPDPHHGKRDPRAHAQLPAFVREDGTEVPEQFSLIHWEVWRTVLNNAFQLAEAGRSLPIAAVKVDLETINSGAVSYDDASWRQYAAEAGLPADIPAAERVPLLEKHGKDEAYRAWFVSRYDEIAARFERELHAINPDLHLGVMPAKQGGLIGAFVRRLGTARAPAIIDHWCMYNGSGFDQNVLDARAWVVAANPHNLFVPWFRVNNYRPGDIAVQAYHAAMATDGYSNWSMGMLEHESKRPTYRLPPGTTAAEYFAAYRRANEAVLADLAAGATVAERIPWTPVEPLAPPLNLGSVKIPDLRPAGDGSGEPVWLHLREQQTVYIYAQQAESLRVDIRHLAGASRPVALHYALLDRNRNELRHETVAPGAQESFTVTAPYTGTYALVITGGAAGQAWYGVRVHNRHMGLALEPAAYWFFRQDRGLWFSRTSAEGEASVRIRTGRNQAFEVRVPDEAAQLVRDAVVVPVPAGVTPFPVTIARPDPQPDNTYTQDIHIAVDGALAPFASDGPERRLVPGE